MEQLNWIDACARRLTELARMTPESADRIAARLWNTKEPVSYRQDHPVLAAETWYDGATSNPAASYAAALECEKAA